MTRRGGPLLCQRIDGLSDDAQMRVGRDLELDADTDTPCSIRRAAQLLGWSESKVRRQKSSLVRTMTAVGVSTLSLAAVMPERAKIVSQLGAAEPVEISPGIDQVSRGEAYEHT